MQLPEDSVTGQDEMEPYTVNLHPRGRNILSFKPLSDLEVTPSDRRNSWSQSSQHSTQASPTTPQKPSTTDDSSYKHLPPTPETRSKRSSTTVTIPKTQFPPTPDPTPTRNLKRSYSTALEVRLPVHDAAIASSTESPSSLKASKRRATSPPQTSQRRHPRPTPSEPTFPRHAPTTPPPSRPQSLTLTLFHPSSIPKFSIKYKPPPPPLQSKPLAISAVELKRAAESILMQVDWEEVAEDVASNRSAKVFRRVIRDVLQGRIDEMVGKAEGGRER